MLSAQQLDVIACKAIESKKNTKLSEKAEKILSANKILESIGQPPAAIPEDVQAELDAIPLVDFAPITATIDQRLTSLDESDDRIKAEREIEVRTAKERAKTALMVNSQERYALQRIRAMLDGKTSVKAFNRKKTSGKANPSYRRYKMLVDIEPWISVHHEDGRITAKCPICEKEFFTFPQGFRQHIVMRHQKEAEERGYCEFLDP
jgi:hypothetical protein